MFYLKLHNHVSDDPLKIMLKITKQSLYSYYHVLQNNGMSCYITFSVGVYADNV